MMMLLSKNIYSSLKKINNKKTLLSDEHFLQLYHHQQSLNYASLNYIFSINHHHNQSKCQNIITSRTNHIYYNKNSHPFRQSYCTLVSPLTLSTPNNNIENSLLNTSSSSNNNNNNIHIKQKSNKKNNLDKENEDEGENDLITQCIDIKCSLNFKVPSRLRGKEGHCPQCGLLQPFKKHTSNYQRLLRKKREQYLEELESTEKLNSQIDLEKYPPIGLSALLDDCRSSENTGSFFRTCDGSGFSRLYLCGITSTPTNVKVAKTALGAEIDVPWSYSPSALACVKQLKEKGVVIIGIEQTTKSKPLLESLNELAKEIEITDNDQHQKQQHKRYRPICLLFGNEVAGLSREVIEECDYLYDLPMRGNKRSLNVAVSFGIVAYVISQHFQSLIRNK